MWNSKRMVSVIGSLGHGSRLARMMSHVTSSEIGSVPWKEIRIPVPWGHIAGKEWGVKDGEPILGIHGWQDNSATFDRLAPLLPLSKMRLIAIDLPGHGVSSHLPEGAWYRWSDYVLSVARVVDSLEWEKFSLLSHSMGAKVSYIYAGCFPEKVKRIVEIDMPRPLQGISRVIPKNDENWDLTNVYRNWIELVTRERAPVVSRGRPMEELIEKLSNATIVTRDAARVILSRGTRQVSSNPDLYVITRDRRLNMYDFLLAPEHFEQIVSHLSCELLVILATKGATCYEQDVYWKKYFNKDFDMNILDKFKKNLKVFRCEYVEGRHHVHINNAERVSSIVGEFLLSSKY